MRHWLFPLMLVWPVLALLGCERVLSSPVERRAYLDVPAEGDTVSLPPDGTLTILAHVITQGELPSAWRLRWQGEGEVSDIQGALSLPLSGSGRAFLRARVEGWPPEPLPPGRYRLWVEVEGADLPPSRPAWIQVLSPQVFRDLINAAPLAVPSPATATPVASTPPPSATATPTMPFTPTIPPTPTATFTPTATPLPCYRAAFVADITLPDGTRVPLGFTGEKVWRLRNTGSCTWTASTQVIQTSGPNVLPAGSRFVLGRDVPPGAEVDVRVTVKLDSPGRIRAEFFLLAPDGTRFGVGQHADRPFWLEVVVEPPTPTPTWTPVPTATYTPTPADTQGPQIGGVQLSSDALLPPPCAPSTVTVEAYKVTDPSGVASVVVRWRLVDGNRAGPWVETPMARQGDNYFATLDFDTVINNLPPPHQQPYVQIQVKATDTLGNVSYSASLWVQIYQCVQ